MIVTVVGVLVPRGLRMASGCDGSPEIARVGAGSTGRWVPRVVGTGSGRSAGSSSWSRCGTGECIEGSERERGERCRRGEVQQPAAAGAGVPGWDGEQPQA